MNSAVRELQTGDLKRCPKCLEPQPLSSFYTKGTDRNGRIRYDTYCIEHKLQSRNQKNRKLRLLRNPNRTKSSTTRIDIGACVFSEVMNALGEYLPSQLQASISNIVYEAIFRPESPPEEKGVADDR